MDKDQLLKFISLIIERNSSHTMVLSQLLDILKAQKAPQEFIDLVEYSCDGFGDVKNVLKTKSVLTEQDIRDAEARYRKMREENVGRC